MIYALNGNVIFANFHAARIFAQKMNQKRDLIQYPELTIKAGQINALGLIDEILHFVFKTYLQKNNPQILVNALSHLESQFGRESVDRLLFEFCVEFPPISVYTKEITIEDYLEGSSVGISHRVRILEELLLLWVTNRNPAAISDFKEIFDENKLSGTTKYALILNEIYSFFETQPYFGPDNQNLIDMLRSPALAIPNSLPGQLEYIRSRWGIIIGKYLYRLLISLDLIKEEEELGFSGVGPGKTRIPIYAGPSLDSEVEQYSADKEWMPRLVLMAKNTLVWLDQLSKKYQTSIIRLDQIPDEELELLASRGFTGLWLIGLWERSKASAQIKQMCGNPDAVSSAYSLAKYDIAYEIGGIEAYENLRNRAWQKGIRLASDMVPNHMAIDSDWVVHNPDRFISLPYSPFPSYTFEGKDLSPDPQVEIKIEDHYYDRTDAAVVFKRVDRQNGDTRFIYHGNDGTSMPWNDTAQLNYLNPEVRETVIQTILEVARKFPIIRFDAAMTLARKHFQRLWFPEPGGGGDIPSRAENGLPRDVFLAAMPQEFWREVVDRVAREAPDTLLLAEAFWLMEGYFVRTLGMHRVYNSAFMNMLRNEENAKFRQLIKNTLEYDPEILRRYVNFISNPDERTSVDQFGKSDKYFGTCTLMVTLPGLPMFGHGQIEGFTEKYGMEYKRAYYDETPDTALVERHEREIFPLLQKRALFAGIEDFHFYDFFTANNTVDENVIVYTNGMGNERVLVAFHNHFSETSGWIRISCTYSKRLSDGTNHLVQTSLVDGLNLQIGTGQFVLFKNQNNKLEYIRHVDNMHDMGLFIHLQAFSCCVFQDFRVVEDDSTHIYRRLCDTLNGEGVPSITDAIHDFLLEPILQPLQEILNAGYFNYLEKQLTKPLENKSILFGEARNKMLALIRGAQSVLQPIRSGSEILDETAHLLEILFTSVEKPVGKRGPEAVLKKQIAGLMNENKVFRLSLITFIFMSRIGKLIDPVDYQNNGISLFDEWKASQFIQSAVKEMGVSPEDALRIVKLVRVLISLQNWTHSSDNQNLGSFIQRALSNSDIQLLLQVNRYQDILWYSKEGFTDFQNCLLVTVVFNPVGIESSIRLKQAVYAKETIDALRTAGEKSKYQIEKLVQAFDTASDQAA